MNIRAVIFDMGGTLETYGYTRELRLKATAGIQKILEDACIHLDLSDESLLGVVTSGLQRYHNFRLQSLVEYSPQKVWREFILKEFSGNQMITDEIAEKLMTYIETHYYIREMRPEIPNVLKAIQESGLKIGLISNVISRGQVLASLKDYKIEKYFDPIVLSSECGIRKPDPSIFHHTARLMNVPTSACVYVGDRIARDIVGAQKAGFRLAIQIQHDFEHGEEDEGATPDALICSMTELIDILNAEQDKPEKLPSSQIRAFLFDAGDVLYHRPNQGENILSFLKENGLDTEKDHSFEKKSLTQKAFSGQIDQDEYYENYLQIFGVNDPEQIQRGKKILEEENLDVHFFEGVRETLISLKNQGYLLGVITDTANSIHTKLSWFERGGFGHVWDSIISSKDIGVQKPNPEIYFAALKQLGLSPKQAAFIGHDISELNGARAVGLKTIAFNYDDGAKADHFINRFSELLELPQEIINGKGYSSTNV